MEYFLGYRGTLLDKSKALKKENGYSTSSKYLFSPTIDPLSDEGAENDIGRQFPLQKFKEL